MKIVWLGHSCFLVESNGYRIVLDPYRDSSVPGYSPLKLEADQVLCSHEHADHNGVSCVTLRTGADSPFTITKLQTWHDGRKGALRGPNTIHILDDGVYRIAHLGDLGCRPEPEQMEQLTGLDLVMIPVGGFYTIGGEQAASLAIQMRPRICVPMHFRGEGFGYSEISTVNDFLDLQSSVTTPGRSDFSLDEDNLNGVVLLTPLNAHSYSA